MHKVIAMATACLTIAGTKSATATASFSKTIGYDSAATEGEINTYLRMKYRVL